MVTTELAFASLAAVTLAVILCWGVFVVVMQVRCIDTASEVARQAARGDSAALERARDAAPSGAHVQITRGVATVVVDVTLDAKPFTTGLPAIGLRARSEAVWEPGEGGRG